MVCDSCRAVITRVTQVPPEGWPQLRSLCSSCFSALWSKSIARA